MPISPDGAIIDPES